MSLSLGKNNVENKQFLHFHWADLNNCFFLQNSSQKCFNSLHAGNLQALLTFAVCFFQDHHFQQQILRTDAKQFGSRSFLTNAMKSKLRNEFTPG